MCYSGCPNEKRGGLPDRKGKCDFRTRDMPEFCIENKRKGIEMTEDQKEFGEHAVRVLESTERLPVSRPNDLLQMLIERNASLEMVEKFMDLRDRQEANEARKAYMEAMSQFKANPPEIDKDATVSYEVGNKTTRYTHATLGNVTNTINRALGECGLSASWHTDQANGITVTCTITHIMGHSESTSLSALPDTSGSKNPIQALGSTISYLERYTILALTGLATKDMDDDGKFAGDDFITEAQAKQINTLIKGVGADPTRFLKFMQVETVDTIPASKFKMAIAQLNRKVGK